MSKQPTKLKIRIKIININALDNTVLVCDICEIAARKHIKLR